MTDRGRRSSNGATLVSREVMSKKNSARSRTRAALRCFESDLKRLSDRCLGFAVPIEAAMSSPDRGQRRSLKELLRNRCVVQAIEGGRLRDGSWHGVTGARRAQSRTT